MRERFRIYRLILIISMMVFVNSVFASSNQQTYSVEQMTDIVKSAVTEVENDLQFATEEIAKLREEVSIPKVEEVIKVVDNFKVYKTTNNIKIHKTPESNADIIGVYTKDSMIRVYETVDSKWLRTDDGYIFKGYTREIIDLNNVSSYISVEEFEATKIVEQPKARMVMVEPEVKQSKKSYNIAVTGKSGMTIEDANMILANTNMAGMGKAFIDIEEINNVNAAFAMSVAQSETERGRTGTALSKNNAFGLTSTKGGYMSFKQLQDSVYEFGGNIERVHLSKGRKTVEAINEVYCPGDWNWSVKVNSSMDNIYNKLNSN